MTLAEIPAVRGRVLRQLTSAHQGVVRAIGALATALLVLAPLRTVRGQDERAKPAAIKPFKVHVPDSVLADLRRRLAETRWPEPLPGTTWEYGADISKVRELARYWQNGYDWRAQEARINRFDQFTTEIDGQTIHFIHVRSPRANAIPLMLIHGWPGSFLEFLALIEPLTNPKVSNAPAFDVIVPSLPGFGFSGPTTSRGWGTVRMAKALIVLMDRLGYSRYGIQGGDWGSEVARQMARLAPSHVMGLHLNLISVDPPSPDAVNALTPEERRQNRQWWDEGRGDFFELQAREPQTVDYALTDSPVGWLAWLTEKFQDLTDNDGDFLHAVDRNTFLTDVTLYWVTGTVGSSMRIYRENRLSDSEVVPPRLETPIGYAVFPKEVAVAPERWIDPLYNVIQRTEMPKGGHFAALEQPDLLVRDIRLFFTKLEAGGDRHGGNVGASLKQPIDPAVAAMDTGFVSAAVQVNGMTLHYVRGGAGPVVILLHGFPEDWYAYHKVMPPLARKFTVVAVDLPGIGGSTGKPGGYAAADMADDVHQLQVQLHLEHAFLVGHDIGGMVAYAFVRRYPDALRGAMLLDAPVPGLTPWKEFTEKPFVWHIHFQQVPGLPEELVAGRQAAYFRYFLDPAYFSDADVARYAESYAAPDRLHAAFEIYRGFPANAQFNAAQQDRIDVPLVVVAGSESPVAQDLPVISEALRAHGLTHVSSGVIQGSSHYIADERPEELTEFIARYASP
jgi:epoxide hydrolase